MFSFLSDILAYINPLSDKFLLKDVLYAFGDLLEFLNPFSDKFILLKLWDFLSDILGYINPFSDKFLGIKIIDLFRDLLKFLFIPSDGYFDSIVEDMKYKISKKIPYQDYIDMFETLEQVQTGESISVGLNNYNFGNGLIYNNHKFIDFSWVTKYKNTWYSWARGIIFILLIIYNINQIMKLFRGYNIGEGMSRLNTGGSDRGEGK